MKIANLQMAIENDINHFYSESKRKDCIDFKYGYVRISDYICRTGYLVNIQPIELLDEEERIISALDLFFIGTDDSRYKYSIAYMPYFLLCLKKEHCTEVIEFIKTKFGAEIASAEILYKEDLDLPNHLTGIKQLFLKISFYNQNSLIKTRKFFMTVLENNITRSKKKDIFAEILGSTYAPQTTASKFCYKNMEPTNFILDIREYDVPYHVRVSIDLKIFCGMWYDTEIQDEIKNITRVQSRPDILERPEPVVLAFDIETTKLPLKFPDAQADQIIMISYMVDGKGYLITNREVISADVLDFEYTPKPEFEGKFSVYNETNEMQVIKHFFNHIKQLRPHIFVTYNGDFFDWPFIETRAAKYGLNLYAEIGFAKSNEGIYLCRSALHMDCLFWVKRDSYLPVGSQGLKMVAKAKLRYNPIELDPEDMCKMAISKPQLLSNYSVSDAIATFYLYMKYVHPFIFALSTIIPMEPDQVLRKGSGTLCETLLMVQAYHANIVFPNKQKEERNKISSDGHLVDSETYVGGHVEALECGLYRADIPCRFRLDRTLIQQLIENISNVLEDTITNEENVPLEKVINLSTVSSEIKESLEKLYEIPNRLEQPVIYHLDVGAMYPNIILTNRLQPFAIVDDADCAACDFNLANAKCKRSMKWQWRGEMLPAHMNELQRIKQQLEMEKFAPSQPGGSIRSFHELVEKDQNEIEKKRLLDYCRKVYKKTKIVKLEERSSTICQKENSFYVDTVRAFRDRRYEYKSLTKTAKMSVYKAMTNGDETEIKIAKGKEILYDSLQLAHKCILNSFYGYVMRKGARWHSMPMAGIVCLTGSNIIQKARNIIERIGRPLELDTDGIWCILPASFPQVFTVRSCYQEKQSFNVSYPNAVLNNMVKKYFTNEQYHELVKFDTKTKVPEYKIRSENSIFFEVDGPYLAMILPAAKEEGKKLKKRYAVFNFDGSLAELKGFEVKRRGELNLIKNFQSSVFDSFLSGTTLEECYGNVAKIANYWLDVLYSRGQNIPDLELFDLVSENRSMSKKLEDYGMQKSTSISTAKRLAEFLGDQMIKDAGLACSYIISKKPEGLPVTERAIPLAIFKCELNIRSVYLRRWLRDTTMGEADIREVLDWEYYIERLSGSIQKIITIPAAMQGLCNPVPRVPHPYWLHKKINLGADSLKQIKINEIFQPTKSTEKVNEISTIPESSSQNFLKKRNFTETECSTNSSWKEILGCPPFICKTSFEIKKWVLFQRTKWFHQIEIKNENIQKRKKIRLNINSYYQKKQIFSVSEFITRSKKNILRSLWHVIQLTPLNEFGYFQVWIMVENELHKIKLHIPRKLIINQSSSATLNLPFIRKKVNVLLPRSAPRHHTYQYIFEEKVFKSNGLDIIENQLTTDIEGIYETSISLETRFLIEKGCLCYVRNINNGCGEVVESNIYNFEDMESNSSINNYLKKTWKYIKTCFLYQSNLFGKTQLWGLFLPASKKAIVVILDSFRRNPLLNMTKLYSLERNTYLKDVNGCTKILGLVPEQITFDIYMEIDIVQVYRRIQNSLCKYKEDKKGPTLICTQTSSDLKQLKMCIPMLTEFPTVKLFTADDASILYDLDWQNKSARLMIRYFLNVNNVLNLMLEQSRYLNIPIGNIPADPILTGTDLFYARILKKNSFALWWSGTCHTDLGGKECEDFKLKNKIHNNGIFTQNSPGVYTDICVSLSIQNLALNALLQCSKALEIVNGTSMIALDVNQQATLEDVLFNQKTDSMRTTDFSSCGPAVRVLRKLVNGWVREVSSNHNVLSDYYIAHFYRWIRSKTAFMYDAAICNVLLFLMEKMFSGMISELKRLGVEIIFADFESLIINSKKKTINDALTYVEYIVQSIRKIEIYHGVQISFDQSWAKLIWLNTSNFAGLKFNLMPTVNLANDEGGENKTSLIIEFSSMSEILKNSKLKEKTEFFFGSLLNSLNNTQLEKQNILHKVFDLATSLSTIHKSENIAVSKAMKAIVTIINLNTDLNDVFAILRRNLIKVFDLNKLNQDTNFFECAQFIISGFTCKVCNEFRDIDILNNKHRIFKNGTWVLLCHRCFIPHDNQELESQITICITEQIVNFTLQDLKCSQCDAVKQDNLFISCKCSGQYTPDFEQQCVQHVFQILLNVAKMHQMHMLSDFLNQLDNIKI